MKMERRRDEGEKKGARGRDEELDRKESKRTTKYVDSGRGGISLGFLISPYDQLNKPIATCNVHVHVYNVISMAIVQPTSIM